MEYLLLALAIAVVLFLLIRSIGSTRPHLNETSASGMSRASQSIPEFPKDPDPRDFLADAGSWLKAPKPLKVMVQENKGYVVSKLIQFLDTGNTYDRKYAAFALGQVGDESALNPLEVCLAKESVEGVREAVEAALSALREASTEKGGTEKERRRIIENVYDGRSSGVR